ncbi:MAG: hypothetical protein ABR530_10420 [Pyrinomonadaceae bacterium]
MFVDIKLTRWAIVLCICMALLPPLAPAQKAKPSEQRFTPVLWRDPGNIRERDLFYGPGSPEKAPRAPFTFVEEQRDGESPKFEVKDANDVTWVVKMGPESQSEIISTRIVWAMGYFAEEAYYFERVPVQGLPRLSRGRQYIDNNMHVRGARFEPRREKVKRGPTWSWLKNPFVGRREFNGLKTLMVLLANYDTSTANNRILTVMNPENGRMEDHYTVTDIGATLGAIGGLGGKRSKNNLSDYRSARLIKRVRNGMVEFQYRTRPAGLGIFTFVFSPGYWRSQTNKEKAMQQIRAEHVRWIGGMLSRLTDDQLRDAFRAAGYSTGTMNGFVREIRERIVEINSAQPRRRAGRA